MAIVSDEAYSLLAEACQCADDQLAAAYKGMRQLLEQLCRQEMADSSLQLTDLSARIGYVASKRGLDTASQHRLHTFRLTSNTIMNHKAVPTRDGLLRDVKTLAFFVRTLFGGEVPRALLRALPKTDAIYKATPPAVERRQRMRVVYLHKDNDFLYVVPADSADAEPLRVRYGLEDVNAEFAHTIDLLWPYAQLNLLDVGVDGQGVLTPGFIILEPDYLIDISSLAECYKPFGHHPANYLLQRLTPSENTMPLLLGNIANLFLDQWVFSPRPPQYRDSMMEAFRQYPLNVSSCPDLADPATASTFGVTCATHFKNISQVVGQTFSEPGYNLDKADAVLEPSYICEPLGLQGRLDYMQRDMSAFIEMKSGKADEFSLPGRVVPNENNLVQMLLYQAVLQYTMGVDHHQVRAFLLYTRYPLLYPARPSWAMLRRVMNLRNRIVAVEYAVQKQGSEEFTAQTLAQIDTLTLNEKQLTGRFWQQYLSQPIVRLRQRLDALSSLERSYFYTLYGFITTELYTSKSGNTAGQQHAHEGASGLWLSTFDEKLDAGEIVPWLRLVVNDAANLHHPSLTLRVERAVPADMPPNFREGDAVMLYAAATTTDNPTNQLVFKASIVRIEEDTYTLELRQPQQNSRVLPANVTYAIEHDYMDSSYRSMYQGLALFLEATPRRRDLLLGQRQPEFDPSYDAAIAAESNDFERISLKALAAQDVFLLVGPPGTGKTSRALRAMVSRFRGQGYQLLLMSYTNRAVDEICKMLTDLNPAGGYIRIGSESACSPEYRERLLENVLQACTSRAQVRQVIENCPIVVGTVSTLSARPALFSLKRFDVALVDEATQILEPQLLPLLCMPGPGKCGQGIERFVLIGDHKQLPAVVLQSSERSEVRNEALRAVGLTNLKDSLFERLYRMMRGAAYGDGVQSRGYDMLQVQGRMNPHVALFANANFYEGRLRSLGLEHQTDTLQLVPALQSHPYARQLAQRVAFIPSAAQAPLQSVKLNVSEAAIVASLAVAVYVQYASASAFSPLKTLGVIAPYRSQVALIRREIERASAGNAEMARALSQITIDTVERYQGSERDVIIYSFCVSRPSQLDFLCNVTHDNGVPIDRKLNVALTRARRQLLITGVPALLRQNAIYARLIDCIVENAGKDGAIS